MSKLLVELAPIRVLPAVNEVRRVIRHEDQVCAAVTDDLVRNRDAAVLDIPDVCDHACSLHYLPTSGNDTSAEQGRGMIAANPTCSPRLSQPPEVIHGGR